MEATLHARVSVPNTPMPPDRDSPVPVAASSSSSAEPRGTGQDTVTARRSAAAAAPPIRTSARKPCIGPLRRATVSSMKPSTSADAHHDMSAAAAGEGTQPRFRVVHPQGFRILKSRSIVERNMRGYFRLPRPPNAASEEERRRIQRTLRMVEKEDLERRAQVTGNADGVVLDGFLLLSTCGAEDPEDVTAVTLQASELTSSVPEDLLYFTQLTALDLTDNELGVADVLPLPALERLRMVCNNIDSLVDVAESSSSSLSTLTALDLAFNRIPAAHLGNLGAFVSLQKLDLSRNYLRVLPRDLSMLRQVTHLALESNSLADADTFYALSTMPSLKEVNLAGNRLAHVPPLNVIDAGGTLNSAPLFSALETMALADNAFATVAALLPLARLHRTLRTLAVSGNPMLSRHPQKMGRELQRAMDDAVVDYFYIYDSVQGGAGCSGSSNGNAPVAGDAPWSGQNWERYMPARAPEHEEDTGREAGAAAHPSASQSGTAPTAATTEAQKLTVVEYLDRYHINLHCAPRPPPAPKLPSHAFCTSAYRGEGTGGEDGATSLVTLPPYEEFMDIYRIAGGDSLHRSRRGVVTMAQQAVKARGAAVPPSAPPLPVLQQRSTPPPTASPVTAPAAENEEEDEEEMEEEETPLEKDSVFLTGLDDDMAHRSRRQPKCSATAVTPQTSARDADGAAAVALDDDATIQLTLPRSVVSPTNTNVHGAMAELRAMLRKPLPSLPYDLARPKRTH